MSNSIQTLTQTNAKQLLTLSDFETAANHLRCEPEFIMACFEVESNGRGFLKDGRLKILFERHKFYKYAPKRLVDDPAYPGKKIALRDLWHRKYPNICNPKSGGYFGGADEYKRFNIAFALDKHAALMSCSIGAGQTMGFNYAMLGFKTVDEMWNYARTGERAQLHLFILYCIETGLQDELRRRDSKGFAKGYNGADYERNDYDGKIDRAFGKLKAQKIRWNEIDSETTFRAIIPKEVEHPALENEDYASREEVEEVEILDSNPTEELEPRIDPIPEPQPAPAPQPDPTPAPAAKSSFQPQDYLVYLPKLPKLPALLFGGGGATAAISAASAKLANAPDWLVFLLGAIAGILLWNLGGLIIKHHEKALEIIKLAYEKTLDPTQNNAVIVEDKQEYAQQFTARTSGFRR